MIPKPSFSSSPASSLRGRGLAGLFILLCLLAAAGCTVSAAGRGGAAAAPLIDFAALVAEMADLERLARLDKPAFRTVQFSSYDRRSVAPDAEGWYANADGFGREPIPGFQSVLRQPDIAGVGEYLVCDAPGPGAIVRGWSAAMAGTLRVFLDRAETPLYEGPAYDFLARRSQHFLDRAAVELDCGDAFVQQDADYFPIPFGRRLRITWEGKLDELHFYHVQVRLYERHARVRTFDPDKDVAASVSAIYDMAQAVTCPGEPAGGETILVSAAVAPGAVVEGPNLPAGPMAVTELRFRVLNDDPAAALRGTLLRLAFDGASSPQVEAPLGDLFGAGPGVHPFCSLPMSVKPDGTMICRFVMPYEKAARLSLANCTAQPVNVEGAITVAPWAWDARSLHFRARWRIDHDMTAAGPLDMPFAVLRGRGCFAGMAVQVANPSPVPTPWGSWWGEGDEKIFVDSGTVPVAFGTGSEDYFNYSWSRPDLFDHPYCGQPLNEGPGNAGFVSNYRWQVTDCMPFESFLAVYMELWHHRPFPGLGYGRTAYVYARPGAVDDHRPLLASDLVIPDLPRPAFQPIFGATNSTFHDFDAMRLVVEGECTIDGEQTSSLDGRMVRLDANRGARLRMQIAAASAGTYGLNLVAAHRPDSGAVRVLLDGVPLRTRDLGGAAAGARGEEVVTLRTMHGWRRLSTEFEPVQLEAGGHEAAIEIVEPGQYAFYYIWLKRHGD